jgi:hypothetical protein
LTGSASPPRARRNFDGPEAIFNASLTHLQSHRLPAAVAQGIHTRQPMNAAKELTQAQAA